MSIVLLHENDFSKVYFNKELNIGGIEWKDNKLTSDEYRLAFNKVIEYTNGRNIFTNFYSDTRCQSVVTPGDRKWFEEVVIPQAIKNGLKRGAVVISGNVFKKYYMNMIINASRRFPITIKIFDDIDKARTWLQSFDD